MSEANAKPRKPLDLSKVLTKRSQEKLASLDSRFLPLVEALLMCGHAIGLNVQVSHARRSKEEQEALYSIGRTKPGKVVTNAKFGQSAHNFGLAIDVFVQQLDETTGKAVAVWTPAVYKRLWAAAVAAGLDKKGLAWAGNWKSFKEYVHFEHADWRNAK
jgi:peptidoglycan L-alanyl-D-glutamate endopeptidase CwlK